MESLPIALTGIKPTGSPHLGNYFGMIEPALELQRSHHLFVFVADYHAMTTERDPNALRLHTQELMATFLAFGIRPETTLFLQSDIPQVHELSWILGCSTGLGTLQRAHAYKAAEDRGGANLISTGTFTYPVLMAADILLYDTSVVPVGRDQHQHVQMAQEMATHVENHYGRGIFRQPQPLFGSYPVVLGNDGEKMSKSRKNTLPIFASPDEIKKFVKAIKTDSKPLADSKDPATCPLAKLYRTVASGPEADLMDERYRQGNFGYGTVKDSIVSKLVERFSEPRDEYLRLMASPDYLQAIRVAGGMRARETADKMIQKIRGRVGLPVG